MKVLKIIVCLFVLLVSFVLSKSKIDSKPSTHNKLLESKVHNIGTLMYTVFHMAILIIQDTMKTKFIRMVTQMNGRSLLNQQAIPYWYRAACLICMTEMIPIARRTIQVN
jgi:uncharacterized membrane protein